MTMQFDRRSMIALGGFGFAGLLLPVARAAAQAMLGMTGFTHNVASGEPDATSVLLWTRYKPEGGDTARVRAEMSETPDFARIVAGGEMVTGPWRDHTVKISLAGLMPGKAYWYRFIGPDGSKSPVGRTRTLPVGRVSRFNIAVFSCTNIGYGEFNAYGHAAARDDVDLWLHMGDYIYEYGRGRYDAGNELAKRILPADEITSLADYRMRYACYRMDPQLQALHARAAMIPSPDDHESANDSWEGGAENHQPDEGDWANRKAAAAQAWREWLPVSDAPYGRYVIGELATYFRTDTRTLARSRPYKWSQMQQDGDVAAMLRAFRDGPWQEEAATMLGTAQEQWLTREMERSKAHWNLLGVATNMGQYSMPLQLMDWLGPNPSSAFLKSAKFNAEVTKAGLPYILDSWSGYPRARSRLLAAAQKSKADLVVVTGDSHNGWAFDLGEGGKAAGVEFGGHSVTSPGYESVLTKADPMTIARDAVSSNKPELRWMDASNRGYMHLSITPAAVSNEWVFVDTVKSVSRGVKQSHRMQVRKGRRVLDGL